MRPFLWSLALLAPLATTLATTLATPLAAQRAQTRYVAPTNETVFTDTEMSASSIPGHVVWVTNRSTVPIIVYSYQLLDCENVKGNCGPQRINVKVRPAGREVIARIFAKDERDGFRYRLRFGYRADSTNLAAMRVLAGAGHSEAQAELDATREAAEVSRRSVGAADIYLDSPALLALGEQLASIRTEPESLVVREGRAFLLREVRLMALDSVGNLLGRVTGGVRWSLQGTMVLMNRADTVLAATLGRAGITFQLSPPVRPLETILLVIVVPDSSSPSEGGEDRVTVLPAPRTPGPPGCFDDDVARSRGEPPRCRRAVRLTAPVAPTPSQDSRDRPGDGTL